MMVAPSLQLTFGQPGVQSMEAVTADVSVSGSVNGSGNGVDTDHRPSTSGGNGSAVAATAQESGPEPPSAKRQRVNELVTAVTMLQGLLQS